MTAQEAQAERQRYRDRLRELGLLDPAMGSFPGETGGLSTGGVIR
jgi:hypothetical protein